MPPERMIRVQVWMTPGMLRKVKKRMEDLDIPSLAEYIRRVVSRDLMEAGLYGDKVK